MILLTGSTGFLGREILGRLLLSRPEERFAVIVRPPSRGGAHSLTVQRVRDALTSMLGAEAAERALLRIETIEGDVSLESFGLAESEFSALARKVTTIYHSAATTALNVELDTARRINVGGTTQVLRLAREAVSHHGDAFRLHHISTAYVAGTRRGTVGPDELDLSVQFRNGYEQSKAEAEALVRDAAGDIPTLIFRPSIIVGDSVTGETSAFNVIYIPARFLVQGLFLRFPALPHAPFDMVPIDYVADAICYLSSRESASPSGTCYYLSAGLGRESNPWEIMEIVLHTFNNYYRRGKRVLSAPALLPPEVLALATSSFSVAVKVLERMVCDRLNVFRQIVPFLPYMLGNPCFDSSATLTAHGDVLAPPPLFTTYAERLFRYCLDTNWGKRPWTNPAELLPWHQRVLSN